MQFIYHHRTTGRGAEGNHIMSVVRALQAEGHTVTIVSPPGVDPRRTAGTVPLDKGGTGRSGLNRFWKLVSCHFPQFLFEIAELAYNVYAFFRLAALMRRNREAVLYERTAFFLIAGVLAARWFGIPVILEVNEVVGVERARRQVFVRLARWMERRVFRMSSRIVTVSSYLTAQVLARGGRPGAVLTVPNAIDPKRFEQPGGGREIRRSLGVNGDLVIGFVGWFDHWDRLDVLVDAFARHREVQPNSRLLLVGDGPVTAALKLQIAERGLGDRAILTGPVRSSAVTSYIDAMDVCVLPDSNPFGSPMVLFEFMAMGKPVIAPRIAPVRDVIRHGENGWMVEPGETGELTRAIGCVAAEPELRERMGTQARKEVLESHTWKATARLVAELALGAREDARAK